MGKLPKRVKKNLREASIKGPDVGSRESLWSPSPFPTPPSGYGGKISEGSLPPLLPPPPPRLLYLTPSTSFPRTQTSPFASPLHFTITSTWGSHPSGWEEREIRKNQSFQFGVVGGFRLPLASGRGNQNRIFGSLGACTRSEMSSLAPVESEERQRQRYDRHLRLVAGCIPYRLKEDVRRLDSLIDRLEVLMISSPNRDDLVFPKGGWENDETEVEAACREALEEAGVRGDIKGTLGVWVFRSKSSENSGTTGGSCRGTMYALEVKEELASWPEEATHQRRWLTVHDAWKLCRYDWMREALQQCLKFLSGELPLHVSESPTQPPSVTANPFKREDFETHVNVLC